MKRKIGYYWLVYGDIKQIGLYFGNDCWFLMGDRRMFRSECFADISNDSIKEVNFGE